MNPHKHGWTQGPWEYYPANNYVGFAIAPMGTLPTLAAVERPRGCSNAINVTAFNFPGETEANARLMAASPELYEALEKIRDLTAPGQELGISDAIDLICDVWNISSAALSKAKAPAEGEKL